MVAEAHAVLSNPQRREHYDLGEDEDGMNGGGGGGFGGGFGGMHPSDMEEILAQFAFGGGGGGGGGHRGRHTHGFSF